MDQNELRTKILSLVAEYTENRLENKQFIAGETYIRASGESFDKREFELLTRVVLDGWITEGIYSSEFAKNLRVVLDNKVRHVVLTNSGSSANLLAVSAIAQREFGKRQAKPGDEIITPAVGFPTTVSPIIQNGLIPVFVDVNFPNYAPDPVTIEHAITERTKGIIIAHTLGNPFDLEKIRDICDDYNLWMIEDCADGLGSRYNGEPVGTFGNISTTSFFPAHHVTSLDYTEPIIVRTFETKEIQIVEIGKFVEEFDFSDWECLAFDEEGRLEFRRITGTVKHPVDEALYKVTLQTGRNSIVSASHSLFTSENGKIVDVKTSNLSVGDLVFVPNNYPDVSLGRGYVNVKRYFPGSWKLYYESYKISEDFARFLGLFVAEGSFNHTKSGNYSFVFTFSSDEDEIQYAKFLLKFAKEEFGISGNIIYRKDGNSINVVFSDKGLYEFLLSNCGRGAENKKVPGFMFTSTKELIWAFLNGYYDGDGTYDIVYGKHSSNSRKCKTVSRELATGLFYLLEIFGIHPRWSETDPSTRDFGNYVSQTRRTYQVDFSTKSLVDASGFRGDHTSGKRNFGDLSLLKIRKIEEVESTSGYVYDLSVEGYENFVGGIGVCLHNTGQGGAVFTDSPMVKMVVDSLRAWGRSCYCLPGKDNTCGLRFKHKMGDLPYGYDHKYIFSRLGYNLQITDMQSALGLAQLEKLPEFEKKRKHNWQRLHDGLQEYENFFVIPEPTKNSDPSWFGFALTLQKLCPFTRNEIVQYLEEHKIGTRMLFGGNLLQHPAFMDSEHRMFGKLDNSKVITECSFWVGVYPGITDEMLDYILSVFHSFLSKYKRKHK